MTIRAASDPHLRRWMMYVDGENLAIRAKEFAAQRGLTIVSGPYYLSWVLTAESDARLR